MLGAQPNETVVADGSVSFAAGGYAHQVTNRGEDPVHYVDVEIVASPPSSEGAGAVSALPDGHVVALENDRVRVFRLTLSPGGAIPAHRHAGAVVTVVVDGATLESGAVPPGAYEWHETGRVPAARNRGTDVYEVVEIEWRETAATAEP
jgi:predicted metal-dependent enzyme (double-stranded beta helix superfamily)